MTRRQKNLCRMGPLLILVIVVGIMMVLSGQFVIGSIQCAVAGVALGLKLAFVMSEYRECAEAKR
jgi:hypothetical protein